MAKVTIFGGSQPQPGDENYRQAYRLGYALGAAGHTVITGGYVGTMEAASRGGAEAGGHVIGVTCDEIEAWRKVKANAWVKEEVRKPTLNARLLTLIDLCDAAIALPGGPGTLTEIATMWNHLVIDAIRARPLVLVGAGWQAVIETMYGELGVYIPDRQRQYLQFAVDVDEAAQIVVESFRKTPMIVD
jgi:uncharacterized protein (TIGR00730 family)